MPLPFLPLAAALTLLGLVGAAQAQRIEPGLWEYQTDLRQPGKPDLAAQMAQMRDQMKHLPPEARRMLEQQMASAGVGLGKDGAFRNCMAPEDVREDVIREGHREGDCTYSRVSRSGNTWRGQIACTDAAARGEFTTTVHSSTHYTTEAVLTGKDTGRTEMKVQARRVSADCGALAKGTKKP